MPLCVFVYNTTVVSAPNPKHHVFSFKFIFILVYFLNIKLRCHLISNSFISSSLTCYRVIPLHERKKNAISFTFACFNHNIMLYLLVYAIKLV